MSVAPQTEHTPDGAVAVKLERILEMAVLLPLNKAAEALGGISIWTLRKHISRGNVRVKHLGRRVFLDEEEMSRIMRDGLPSLRIAEAKGSDESHGHSSRDARSREENNQEFVAPGRPETASAGPNLNIRISR